jgi:hypothetical protein
MSKYAPWTRFLAAGSGAITLTVDQLAVIAGGDVAPSAFNDNRWWNNNDPSHHHCKAWGDAGYTAHPRLAAGVVTFRPIVPAGRS